MLTKEQRKILDEIFASDIRKTAVWGGGTALSENYLHHRKSDDIDIILSDLPPSAELTILTNKIAKSLKVVSKKSVANMNRFQYFFTQKGGKQQKLEFIYYPFPKLARPKKRDNIHIESLKDIAVSKTLAAYQRQEVKDAFDLFIILKKKYFSLNGLIKGVEKKFGEQIDAAMLLANLTECLKNFNDLMPLLSDKTVKKSDMNKFFQELFNKYMRRKKL